MTRWYTLATLGTVGELEFGNAIVASPEHFVFAHWRGTWQTGLSATT